mgnify:CR=1 FL=1|jgi:hypothetical protein
MTPPTRNPATAALPAALAASLALAGCAQTAAEPEPTPVLSSERQCFFTRQINGYSEAPDGPGGEDRLYVRTGVNDRFLLETFGPCPDLDWSLSIALDTRFSGTSLCSGETVTVLVPQSVGGITDRCTARVLGKVVEPRS